MKAVALDYARPVRGHSAWREPEAFLSTAANVVLVSVALLARRGMLDEIIGVAAGLAIVAAALQLTTAVIAALGVVEARFCGMPSQAGRQLAGRVFLIAAGNCLAFIAGVIGMVVHRG